VTDAAVPLEASRTQATTSSSDRWVLWGLLGFTLLALNFGSYHVFGDGVNYYSLTQRLLGDGHGGSAYNFGVGLMNAPFYAAAKIAAVGAGHAAKLEAGSITLASIFWVLVAAFLSWRVLVALALPHRGLAVTVAVLGTPVWYYASFSPSYSHAADAAAFAAASWTILGVWSSPSLGWRLGAGAAFGLAIAVRPINVGMTAGALIALLGFRRLRDAAIIALGAAATYLVLASIPYALGLPFGKRTDGTTISGGAVGFAPLSPVRMLFTEHRGLFLWTPVTLLAVVGLALLLRRHAWRGYLVTLTAMGGALLVMNVGLKPWDAGWSFSERYLASPVTLYAVGIAGLLACTRGAVRTAAIVAAVAFTGWSLLLGMNHAFGAEQSDGAFAVATKRSPSAFLHRAWAYSRLRHIVDRVSP
jgi:hypothetical protein